MSLAKKLNLKPGVSVRVIGRPPEVDLDDVAVTTSAACPNVLLFAAKAADVDRGLDRFRAAALADGIAWIAYPKGGQLGTDLSRDVLWQRLRPEGVTAVRQVSIDSVWSALRFRPGS